MAKDMIEVYDFDLKRQAILENAKGITETLALNGLYYLNFSLPYGDIKNKYCKPFYYVSFNGIFYRIMPTNTEINLTPMVEYECEHVIATLIDDILYGDIVIGNLGVYTDEVIEYVLSKQKVKRWKLGVCEFARQFEYGWQSESLLSALFSIPKDFAEEYFWEYDTTNYPWTVNLKKFDVNRKPELYIRKNKNLIKLVKSSDPNSVCTKLYAHGYGEGINTLTFADINDGKPYVESPPEIIEKYGIKEKLFVDRRYENKESLLEAAKTMLKELQEPYYEYEVDFVNIDNNFYNKAELGKVAMIIADDIEYKTYITKIVRKRNDDGSIDCGLTIANKPKDIASSVADLADRQRIEMTYAQGATQIYAQSIQNNASSDEGLVMDFFIPEQMKIINKILCKIRMEQFRAFSKATENGGQSTQTSSSGGGSQTTSSSGGGTSKSTAVDGGTSDSTESGGGDYTTSGSSSSSTTNSGGGTSKSTNSGGSYSGSEYTDATKVVAVGSSHSHHFSIVFPSHSHSFSVPDHSHGMSHTHEVRIPSHTHRFSVPSHSHSFSVPSHTHTVNIPAHTHTVSIPGHGHEITPGIYRFGGAKSFELLVNGKSVGNYEATSEEIDLTPLLINPDTGKVNRGSWQNVEVKPSGLAYISIAFSVQGFIQSRGDMTV